MTTLASFRSAGLCVLMLFGNSTLVADDELPDMELLEYLGMWEESDDEWLLFNDPAIAEVEKRSGPAPDGRAPPERQDES